MNVFRTPTARATATAALVFYILGGITLVVGWLTHHPGIWGTGLALVIFGMAGFGAAALEDRERPPDGL